MVLQLKFYMLDVLQITEELNYLLMLQVNYLKGINILGLLSQVRGQKKIG